MRRAFAFIVPMLAGCNAVFGLNEVGLRPDAAGSGGATAVSSASSAGAGGAPNRMCHDPAFMPGLVLDASFEGSEWYGTSNFVFGWGNDVLPHCQDDYYIDATGDGPPRASGFLHGDAIAGDLATHPCLAWSIAARDPNGQNPHMWITFDVTGMPGTTTNLITPAAGFEVEGLDWKFYSGVCRANVPQLATGAIVGIYVEKDRDVHFDAIEAHTVMCDPSIVPCDP